MEIIITYKIDFKDIWHIGSGLSGGADVDAIVLKDANGFPTIPGKTLKGLLREGAEVLAELNESGITPQWVESAFGKRETTLIKTNDEPEQTGKLFFTNAYVSKGLQKELNKEERVYLYDKVASTCIKSDTGIAVKGSLRKSEVTLPIPLFAQIHGINQTDIERLEMCMKMVKRLGVSRNRGLGLCQLERLKEEEIL